MIFPLAAIVAAAKARGVPVLVDGAHAPGQLALDMPALGADWYVGNCHKWLFAGKGCGFLWAAPHARADLQPPVISHDYEKGFPDSFDWIGTRDPSAWLTLPDALAFGDAIGWERIRAHNDALAAAMAEMIARRWGTEIGAAPDLRAAMATIRVPGTRAASDEAAQALRDRLWREHRIEAPVVPFAGALWARISAQIWNHEDEYARLAAALAP
jgi:isopenicillin-N epimerase